MGGDPTAGGTRRVDRDAVFLEFTRSICPVCRVVVDAEVLARDGRIVLHKVCREHGEFEALVYSDADMYMAQQRYNKPGTLFPTRCTSSSARCSW